MTGLVERRMADRRGGMRPVAVAPMTSRLTTRPAGAADMPFVRELYAESRDDLSLLPSDTRDVIIDMQLRAHRRSCVPGQADTRHELLLDGGARAGHLLVSCDAATITVVDLAVRSELRGTGLGAEVIVRLVAEADRSGRAVRARVRPDSEAARRCFERQGFRVGGVVAGCHELYRMPLEVARGA